MRARVVKWMMQDLIPNDFNHPVVTSYTPDDCPDMTRFLFSYYNSSREYKVFEHSVPLNMFVEDAARLLCIHMRFQK